MGPTRGQALLSWRGSFRVPNNSDLGFLERPFAYVSRPGAHDSCESKVTPGLPVLFSQLRYLLPVGVSHEDGASPTSEVRLRAPSWPGEMTVTLALGFLSGDLWVTAG